jgi:hypothetical protein
MIGISVVYPDGFDVVDLIVRGEQFESALDVVGDIQEMLETHDDYMNTFNPEKDFVIELDIHGIEACVLRYITDTSEVSLDTDNVREFFIDLDR